jgi:hypothetical protein
MLSEKNKLKETEGMAQLVIFLPTKPRTQVPILSTEKKNEKRNFNDVKMIHIEI